MPASYPASTDFALRPLRPGDEEALLAIFAATREPERPQLGWSGPEWEAFVRQQCAAQHAQYMRGYANPTFSLVLRGGQPHSGIQPYLALNLCICLNGEYPVRP